MSAKVLMEGASIHATLFIHMQILMNANCTMEDVITIVQIIMAVINVLVIMGMLLKTTDTTAPVG